MATIPMTVSTTNVRAPVTVQSNKVTIAAKLDAGCIMARPYEGETTVTPSAETQTLPTEGFMLTGNVTINPIPSNYGLITWDGSRLTVS